MDFSSLDVAHKKAQTRTQARQLDAGDLISRGMYCLIQGEKGTRDKVLLQEAGDCFLQAVKLTRDTPVPLLGMAYLLWLYNDYDKAMLFVKEALMLDPESDDAQRLLREITARKKVRTAPLAPPALQPQTVKLTSLAKPVPPPVSQPQVPEEEPAQVFKPGTLPQPAIPQIDLGEIEDSLKYLMQKIIGSELMTQKPSARPNYLDKLEAFHSACQRKLNTLAQDLDEVGDAGQELQGLLQRCRKLLLPMHERLSDGRSLLGLEANLNQELELIDAQLCEVRKLGKSGSAEAVSREDLAVLHENLDDFFSQCDGFADLLEQLEKKDYPLKGLIGRYEELVTRISQLEQVLESL